MELSPHMLSIVNDANHSDTIYDNPILWNFDEVSLRERNTGFFHIHKSLCVCGVLLGLSTGLCFWHWLSFD